MTIIHSRFEPLSLPVADIFSFIFNRTHRPFPESHRIFQNADTNEAYSFADIKRMAKQFGQGLQSQLKWQKGQTLVTFAANSIDWPAIILGTLWAGGIVSPSNPAYTANEFANQLKDCGVRAIVTQFHLLETVKRALSIANISASAVELILLDEPGQATAEIPHFSQLRPLNSNPPNAATIGPKKDVAFLVYSSGTTGKPKGVRLSHYNVTSNIKQLQPGDQEYVTWNGSKTCNNIPLPQPGSGGDKLLACTPFFHIYGLTKTIINSLFTGATTIVVPKFEIEKWCALVQKHSITFTYIVPPMVLLLCKHPVVEAYDLSSIRMANSGAATLSPELINFCFKRTGIRIKQGYGMTETCPTVFNQTWDLWNDPVGSTGQLLPNVEAKICALSSASDSENTNDLEPQGLPLGTVGELYVRGPNVFLGYHNNPSATADSLSPTGWYRTGDVGYMDARNNLFITDRVKELIKYKGYQVAPAELEGYLLEHPLVSDCAVVGIQSEEVGTELPRGYVVLKDTVSIDAEELESWFNARVANYKKLRGGVRFVKDIPKSSSGKTLRKVLKEWVKAEQATHVHSVRARL